MPTTQEEKPAKPRQRSRKGADQRKPNAEAKTEFKAELRPEAGQSGSVVAAREAAPVDAAAAETAPVLSGEVLPPETATAPRAIGPLAFAQAYGDYTRKSWQAGRSLIERLIAARSFEETVEIQGEFAKQACANFVSQSLEICGLTREWTWQLFVPFGPFAARWPVERI